MYIFFGDMHCSQFRRCANLILFLIFRRCDVAPPDPVPEEVPCAVARVERIAAMAAFLPVLAVDVDAPVGVILSTFSAMADVSHGMAFLPDFPAFLPSISGGVSRRSGGVRDKAVWPTV